jgi:hypothetical protein
VREAATRGLSPVRATQPGSSCAGLRLNRTRISDFPGAAARSHGNPGDTVTNFERRQPQPATGRKKPLPAAPCSVDLYWLPLGAGGWIVRLNGRIYEALSACLHRRPRRDLYHSALVVRLPEGQFAIESAPIRPSDGAERGVVGEGAVGSRWAGRLRIFRYELRCWRGGHIPDIDESVESPRQLTDDPQRAWALLALMPNVPTPVWGRDELHAGEMWNSNSFTAWLIAGSGLDADAIQPPKGGRAPGWNAGLVVARRQQEEADAKLVRRTLIRAPQSS